MTPRWKRIWLCADLLLGAWVLVLFWLAFQVNPDWWWQGFAPCFLYLLVRGTVFAIDHVRIWRLWAVYDFAMVALVIALLFLSEVEGWSVSWVIGLLLVHVVFVLWRARRWPRAAR